MTTGRFTGLVGSRILAIADEVRALQAGGRQICNLSIGDFDPREFPVPRPLLERIEGAFRRGETNYPPSSGIPALRQQISALYAREFGLSIPAGSIVVTGGARPGLFAAYQLTVDPGDRVVFPVPSWNNDNYCELAGAAPVAIECSRSTAFLPTAAMLTKSLRGARLLVLNSPVNPTGTAFDSTTLGAICDAVLEENARRSPGEPPLYLLYDQVYWMLTFGGLAHVVPSVLRPEIAPYTILVDGISKVFAATGLRVGWVCPPEQLSARFSAFLGHVGAWAPRPAQVGTAEMLADTEAVATARQVMRVGLERRLDRLHAGLMALRRDGLPVEAIAPAGAMYLSVRFGSGAPGGDGRAARDATEHVRRHLLEHAGLAAVPFEAFGYDGEPGWFRLSVGSVSESAIGEALVRLRDALQQLQPPD
ncbi:MAG TPA: aminotransferase class I/II-fold pyridoxal phosphate-dependent enzyme [Gemmatimonadales bacterium]|jgi:aspartate aminotransferase